MSITTRSHILYFWPHRISVHPLSNQGFHIVTAFEVHSIKEHSFSMKKLVKDMGIVFSTGLS